MNRYAVAGTGTVPVAGNMREWRISHQSSILFIPKTVVAGAVSCGWRLNAAAYLVIKAAFLLLG